MYDIVALGECLIDFAPMGKNDQGMNTYSQNPGGAPANVLAMASRLGAKTSFIGKVGSDNFGDFLQKNLIEAKIGCENLVKDERYPTTLAFVQLDDKGDRSFTFYRKFAADVMLSTEDLKPEVLQQCKIFHFGSVSLTDDPCKSATYAAVEIAKKAGAIISYDPNYREFLWPGEECAKNEILKAMEYADVVKVSQEEMVLLTAETDLEKGTKALMEFGAELVVITLGENGAYYHKPNCSGHVPTIEAKTIDTTGAGDAFWGSFLHEISKLSYMQLINCSNEEFRNIICKSNIAGALTTTKKGAIPAMPSAKEISSAYLGFY